MSLLDAGPDEIVIYPEIAIVDEYETPKRGPAVVGVPVRCRVQPLVTLDGSEVQVVTRYKVISRALPAGPWARIEWDGREWDVEGEVLRSNGSPVTRHHKFVMVARKPQLVP